MLQGVMSAVLQCYAVPDTGSSLTLHLSTVLYLVWRLQPGGRGISRVPEVVACQVLHDRLQSPAHHNGNSQTKQLLSDGGGDVLCTNTKA